MPRISAASAARPAAHTVNVTHEVADFKKAVWNQSVSGKLKAAPTQDFKKAWTSFSVTPKGLVDAGASVAAIGDKLYVATSDFAGRSHWFAAPATDLKKLQTLQKDLYAASTKLPAKSWSTKAPEFIDSMGRLPVTPKGLMGVGTTALIGRDGSVWVERRAVSPIAKPEYAKIG